jgi:hypothetical protein
MDEDRTTFMLRIADFVFMRTGSGSSNSTCTGEERKERYQQEGLVPFVSEYIHN